MHQLPSGKLIGNRYEIGEVIGQGGFGITYRGFDRTFEVTVAIKEYYPSGIASRYCTQSTEVLVGGEENTRIFSEGKEKFLSEARILARVSDDPNIVNVRDFFEENNTAYIVMQYLEGENLKDYSEHHGKMSFNEAFELLRPIMRSLGFLHESGLIHRDISPSNMILLANGTVKLIDFGTTRQISAGGEKSLSVLLNPGYAPPEQYRTRGSQGPWTDVYAMCASLYKLITGEIPENSLNRLMDDNLKAPSMLGAVITPPQEAALIKGMALDSEERYQSMAELEKALETGLIIAASEEPDTISGAVDEDVTIMGPQDIRIPVAQSKKSAPEQVNDWKKPATEQNDNIC